MCRMDAATNFWKSRRAVGLWLLGVAGVILFMIGVGGLTRLTGSGLSITEWKPIMRALPPLNDAQWHDAFEKYKQIPQYLHQNQGMTLDGFKSIFWWEWGHRFLGRLLGFLFLLPFLLFAATGAIRRSEWPRFVLLFLLGGLQGFIGWWMVSSGLEVRTSVSPYRLAIHLGAALVLLAAMVWIGLEYLRGPASGREQSNRAHGKGDARRGFAFAGLVYFQMLLGALVAGLHAGFVYNTWPDMNGRVFPEDAFFHAPWWINFFENEGLVQFNHRMVAYAVAAFAAVIYARGIALGKQPDGTHARNSAKAVAILTILQVFLGIVTLVLVAPPLLAALHQLMAAFLLCAAIWHAYELKRLS